MELTRRSLSGLLAGLTAKVMVPGKALATDAIGAAEKAYALKAAEKYNEWATEAVSVGTKDINPLQRAALDFLEDHFRDLNSPIPDQMPHPYGVEFKSMSIAAKKTFCRMEQRKKADRWNLYRLAREEVNKKFMDVI